ncbi:Acetyltransferase (GNAT) family protein [Pseudomonas oleovorans subsp. oleovorans]|uniref:N-acetyltransferase GCN5 n=1 Tax=Ectopseudomonas oleovorans TaxID=301 RepID=A0A2W5X9U2_ECTOL|nr:MULTISPECIES: GNAT family N-acetyltransferase [Pseudomonas aeruginosa group]MDH2197744.1 GNAT family N-acetyltransferase [Pseudomonas oleovorans]OWK45861.1 Acetyltransferase (GNAT) family protein [Pseudomonas oleovorans subsp. oleovorans]PZR43948.1 MAG: N-acetyltransferase [Pseudomonas oleovorans]TXR36894.1 GNAT family N-acetyltransferase [Pseudomonas mendocina]SEJ09541.1 Acetyltransferase (GNAT) domain-containing protein [Pseudomonas oleovorans]
MTSPRFRRLPLQLRPLVDKFYRDHRSPMRSQAGDELWVAENASEIVATLSLRPVAGGEWLTGLFVAPALRRQGVAAALLSHSLALHPEPVWLFCHPELRSFYQRLGFEDCQGLPTELAVRLTRYQRNKSLASLRIH